MKKPIINLKDVELQPRNPAFAATGEAAERFDAKTGMIAQALGAQKLGYNITSVPPGKCAFPLHNHYINEEMFLILDGSGEIRIGEDIFPLKQHDIIACPPGDKNTAHQIKNTGEIDLKYLAVSTKLSPEIVDYPDSGKFGVLADFPADAEGNAKRFIFVGRENESKDYWEDE